MTSENQALDEKMPNVHELIHPLREEARTAHNVWVQRASFVVRPCSQAKSVCTQTRTPSTGDNLRRDI